MPIDDAWDWPELLYIGTIILKMPEAKFWRTSPRKLRALTRAHISLNSSSEEGGDKKSGYIDQVL